MSKVRLTIDQSRMINNHRSHFESLMSKRNNKNTPTTLDDVSVEDVVKAFFNGYEVVTEFSEGEWVITGRGKVGVFSRVEDNFTYTFHSSDGAVNCSSDNLRHATLDEVEYEKKRVWWKRHGRKVGEIKQGDVLENIYSRKLCEVLNGDKGTIKIVDSSYKYDKDILLSNFKVVCFVENREDREMK